MPDYMLRGMMVVNSNRWAEVYKHFHAEGDPIKAVEETYPDIRDCVIYERIANKEDEEVEVKKVNVRIPVCYKLSSSDIIKWDEAVGIEKQLDGSLIVRFADGGWNPAEDCFFTEEQCRNYYRLPPVVWKSTLAEIGEKVEGIG